MNNIRSLNSVQKKQYKAGVYCGNCHHTFDIDVEMGKLACQQSYTCAKCGCTKEQVEEERLKQQVELQRQGVMPSGAQLGGPQ